MLNNQPKHMSVCLPTYDMYGMGHIFLKHSFEILKRQSFTNFDIVISDYSKTSKVKELCDYYKQFLDIKYFKNFDPTGGMAANTNNAIKHATGKIIKILFQDDFLYNEKSLETIAENFDLTKDRWLVTACEHSKDGSTFFRPHNAVYNNKVYLGNNTIGSPSVLSIKNDHPLLFDTNLKWLVDCDYYKRCYDIFGKPKIINDITVAIRVGEHQITNTEATKLLRKNEYAYIRKKHHSSRRKNYLPTVTVVAVSGINPEAASKALEICMDGIDFYESVLIAHNKPDTLYPGITFKQCLPTDLANQDPKNSNDYSKFMLFDLWKYIDSDFALIVHNNAYVIRPNKWEDEFLKYDYIGAPWPKNVHYTPEGKNVRVGNGGFSLRSKKMLRAIEILQLPFTDNGTGYFHEDGVICVYYRKKLEEYGLKFATADIASRFSREVNCDDSVARPFGFHNNPGAMPRFFHLKRALKKLF
jgi:hypothetical protein